MKTLKLIKIRFLYCTYLIALLFTAFSNAANPIDILSMKERAQFIDNMTDLRIKTLMPKLMNEHNIDMWILISREYNEDPIVKTMLPATWLSARRTTILMFARNKNNKVDAWAIAPYKIGNSFKKGWDKTTEPNQWQALNALITKYQPDNIALNTSTHWAHADGLTVGDQQRFLANLPQPYHNKIISSEPLAIAWLEQRIAPEVEMYKNIVAIAHEIIAEGFSTKAITVGETTSDDLVWWFRERIRQLKLQTWFHPSVAIQRADNKQFDHEQSFTNGYNDKVIRAGDLLHVDFGITYLRLNTDTQQHAYILKPEETQAPAYLVNAFNSANKLQDIFTAEFKAGKTGNQVLAAARRKAIAQGLKPTIYTHPLGYHGHAAGTTLGMWDSQQGVAGDGDYPLHLNTAYSIELNNAVFIKPWNKEIRIMLEEDAFFDNTGVWYLNSRQTKLILIK
ncbi:aminopeptidase P family protein [Pseudoalteromonas sp. MMG010]|uniref:M24 family metallopeptidase n=1 Tax=Pseudoalteromonas sp. MMG010 TaxID=2822685 RepID=UPI001B3A44FA|nr:M24 family metallopeptidase [Pseudoalteromonas sp. MMG010]MBQ4832595.1 aminopeptidase P family protein [Pseudoalteromonas sp. MMG010]